MNNNGEYFENLAEIEKLWHELKKNDFPQKLRDDFWAICVKGRILFWQLAIDIKDEGIPMVKTVPAFQRAIMLLEHEKKLKNAIRLCEEANKWEIDTDWYAKRIKKLKNKL